MHLSQWEWSDTPGRLEEMYKAFLLTTFRGAHGYTSDYTAYADGERKLLNEAKTCFLAADMMDVALFSAGIEFTLRDPDDLFNPSAPRDLWLDESRIPVLRREMLPAETGFLVLEEPFPMADYDAPTVEEKGHEALNYVEIKAIGWQVVPDVSSIEGAHPGIALYLYTEPFEDMKKSFRERGWGIPPLMMVDFSGWSFDTEFVVGEWIMEERLNPHEIRPHVASVRMFMAAVWGLMNSYIEPQRRTGPQFKRARRLKMPEDGDISVIHLRKFLSTVHHKTEAEDYDEEGNPNWSHRWLVRPHWAWRACKCPGHGGRHRVYIEAYTKGPEHLPLVIKEKVLSIDR